MEEEREDIKYPQLATMKLSEIFIERAAITHEYEITNNMFIGIIIPKKELEEYRNNMKKMFNADVIDLITISK